MKACIKIIIHLSCAFIAIQALSQISKIDSLETSLDKVQNDSLRLSMLNDLSFLYSFRDSKVGLKYGERAKVLAEEVNNSLEKANALNNIGINQELMGNYSKALESYQGAIAFYKKSSHQEKLINPLNNIGNIYAVNQKTTTALDYYNQALTISEKYKLKEGKSLTLLNLGVLYHFERQYDKALAYYLRVKEIDEELQDSINLPTTYNNIALIHKVRDDFQEAALYYNKALKIAESQGNTSDIALNNLNLSLTLKDLGQADKALQHARLAEEGYIRLKHKDGVIKSKMATAKIFNLSQQYDNALRALVTDGIDSVFTENLSLFGDYHFLLADVYEQLGQYKEALEAEREANRLLDSARVLENLELTKEYELDIISAENEELKDETRSQTQYIYELVEKIDNQKVIVLILLVLSSALFISVFILFRERRKRKLINEQLIDRNQKIESLNMQLVKKVNSLEEAMKQIERSQNHILEQQKLESNNRLAAALGHEINNPLNFILKCAEILKNDKSIDRKEVDFILEGAHRINSITYQLNHFLSGAESDKEKLNVNMLITETINLISDRLDDNTNISLKLSEEDPHIYGYKYKMFQALIQIVLNAIDFTPEIKEIEIESKVVNNIVFICITDNGVGINKENLVLVFDPFFTTKNIGKGIGLGLYSSNEIIKFHNGSIHLYSGQSNGTKVEIKIPYIDER